MRHGKKCSIPSVINHLHRHSMAEDWIAEHGSEGPKLIGTPKIEYRKMVSKNVVGQSAAFDPNQCIGRIQFVKFTSA